MNKDDNIQADYQLMQNDKQMALDNAHMLVKKTMKVGKQINQEIK